MAGTACVDEYGYKFELGKAKTIRDGNDVLIISTGLMTMRALEVLVEHQGHVAAQEPHVDRPLVIGDGRHGLRDLVRRTSTSRSSAPCPASPPATARATRRRRTSRSSAANTA
jgi:hypothetical protein